MKLLIVLLVTIAYSKAALRTCKRSFSKVGCFERNKVLLPKYILNGRKKGESNTAESGLISWKEYTNYLHSLACECAEKAKSENYNTFAIGFYGECHAGQVRKIDLLSSSKSSTKCVAGTFVDCDDEADHECAGGDGAEYVYTLNEISAGDTTKQLKNGGYGNWSDWTQCDQTCGEGSQVRERSCTNPLPENGGSDCEELGDSTESRICNVNDCPVDGRFTRWSDYNECSASCGGGSQKRTRTCTNPEPSNGGADCDGVTEETQQCGMDECPIDGGFTEWSDYDKCTATCNGGTQRRERSCTNPKPQHGGDDCVGETEESRVCNKNACPIDGSWSSWSAFDACSKTCGEGVKTSKRSCINPTPQHGGHKCQGDSEKTQKCVDKACPINGQWTAWSSYTTCSKTCDKGTKKRTRTCSNPAPKHNGLTCSGKTKETVNCNVGVRCPYYTAYHENQACEGGSMKMWCTDKKQVIKLAVYWYGRKNKSTCNRGINWFWSTNCQHQAGQIYNTCQNKNSCRVYANNKWMGKDPCWGTYKYFYVKFRCYG